jgi:hypothetical protein
VRAGFTVARGIVREGHAGLTDRMVADPDDLSDP